ncbi:hypothetical protein SEA_WOFFORD_226 [Streptomyces phage Wofford]|uniref:Uncharacterized protein n=1 Tax=Streptomyces phage Wofford TaxID=2283267 RepID=A0A345MA42_9CAUD|nr:hypothetical protein HWB78_gp092 [Streptomyces phage Wollford]AXH67363.1 hypothetical protein SEA_WOFFORD_226 [Streptomyces phage Wollford]
MIYSVLPEKVTYLEWHYIDMEEFVKNLYGQEWEGAAALGFPAQDTYHDFDVTGGQVYDGINDEGEEVNALWMDEGHTFDQAKAVIEKFKTEGMPREEFADPGAELMLNWLCHEGHIPAGKYRIIVWW